MLSHHCSGSNRPLPRGLPVHPVPHPAWALLLPRDLLLQVLLPLLLVLATFPHADQWPQAPHAQHQGQDQWPCIDWPVLRETRVGEDCQMHYCNLKSNFFFGFWGMGWDFHICMRGFNVPCNTVQPELCTQSLLSQWKWNLVQIWIKSGPNSSKICWVGNAAAWVGICVHICTLESKSIKLFVWMRREMT